MDEAPAQLQSSTCHPRTRARCGGASEPRRGHTSTKEDGVGGGAVFVVPGRQRTTTRPTYETNPLGKGALMGIPPILCAGQKMGEPRPGNQTRAPDRAPRTG